MKILTILQKLQSKIVNVMTTQNTKLSLYSTSFFFNFWKNVTNFYFSTTKIDGQTFASSKYSKIIDLLAIKPSKLLCNQIVHEHGNSCTFSYFVFLGFEFQKLEFGFQSRIIKLKTLYFYFQVYLFFLDVFYCKHSRTSL